jgi:glutaconate CoA-transferase, subunit A
VTRILTPTEAAAEIADGSCLGIGGLQGNFPMATIRALARRGARGLDVLGAPVGMAAELLIAAGSVRRLAAPYMGVEGVIAVAPAYRAAVESGELELWECDEAILLAALRAAAQGLPFMPWRGGVGTDLPAVNPELTEFVDEPSGERLLRVPARRPDVALFHALEADEAGNVRYHDHSAFADPAIARAADRVVVEVERIVDHETFLSAPERTVIHRADAVVLAPCGSHPFRASGVLEQDDEWLREWNEGVRAALREGTPAASAEPVRRELEPDGHDAYLESIAARLDRLRIAG